MAGLSPDGGLFIPHTIPALPSNWKSDWATKSFQELALEILSMYIDESEIPRSDLKSLIPQVLLYFPIRHVTPLFRDLCTGSIFWSCSTAPPLHSRMLLCSLLETCLNTFWSEETSRRLLERFID